MKHIIKGLPPTSSRFKNLTGQTFHRLTVLSYYGSYKKYSYYECLCQCGKTTFVRSTNLVQENTKSCGCGKKGCTRRKRVSAVRTVQRIKRKTPKKWKTATYRCWENMWSRCRYHPNYLAKGITVCKEWLTYSTFLADMGDRPAPKFTLERIDNSLGYSKDNCRWATMAEQSRNKGTNINIAYRNKIQCLKDWSIELGLNYGTLHQRWRRGITTPEELFC